MLFYYPVMLFYFSGDIVNILVKKSGDLKIFLSAEYHLSGENNPVKFKKNPVTKELILFLYILENQSINTFFSLIHKSFI